MNLDAPKVQWGLGIEHEVNFYTQPTEMSATDVLQQFGARLNRPDVVTRRMDLVRNLLRRGRTYEVQNRYSSTALYMAIKYLALPQLLGPERFEALERKLGALSKHDEEVAPRLSDETMAQAEEMASRIVQAASAEVAQMGEANSPLIRRLIHWVSRAALDWSDLGVYIEFVTRDFRNATVGSITAELRLAEQVFMEAAVIADDAVLREAQTGMYPLVAYHHDRWGNEFPPNEPPGLFTDYNGSYHLNITLPYLENVSDEVFLKQHRAAMLLLQWMEPLFVGVWGQPDEYAFWDMFYFTEGSYRMMVNAFSSLGTQDVSVQPDWLQQMTMDEITLRQPDKIAGYRPPLYKHLIYDIITGYLRPKRIGADFRRDPEKKQFGFEFRILDHFPTRYLVDVMRILVLICDHSFELWSQNQLPADPRFDGDWTALVVVALTRGWNGPVREPHIQALERALQLDLGLSQEKDMFQVLQTVVDKLWSMYGEPSGPEPAGQYSSLVARTSEGEYYTAPPRLVNINYNTRLRSVAFWKGDRDLTQWLLACDNVKRLGPLKSMAPNEMRAALETCNMGENIQDVIEYAECQRAGRCP